MRFALYDDEAVVDHQFAKIKAAFAKIDGRRGLGHEGRAGGHPVARAPRRAHPGRRPEPRLERDDRLVRRRGGRPHRLLADRAAGRQRVRARCATCCAGMIEEAGLDYIAAMLPVSARSFAHITMVIFDTKNEEQTRSAYTVASAWSPTAPSSATANTAPTSTSWTSPPTSTRSTTTPTDGSARRSRTRSTPTGSSRRASRASGRGRCARPAETEETDDVQGCLAGTIPAEPRP